MSKRKPNTSALISISIDRLLDLWTDLEQAYYGKNPYGGHIAELYAYRFGHTDSLRTNPAAEALRSLLTEFEERRECVVEVQIASDKWRRVGPWLGRHPFVHREHVRVVRTL